jgi:hypothetical protein
MWSAKNNKYYRGRADRMAVSINESLEVDDFIAQFILANHLPDMDSNRQRVATEMTKYPTHAPWRQHEVAKFVRQKMNI